MSYHIHYGCHHNFATYVIVMSYRIQYGCHHNIATHVIVMSYHIQYGCHHNIATYVIVMSYHIHNMATITIWSPFTYVITNDDITLTACHHNMVANIILWLLLHMDANIITI